MGFALRGEFLFVCPKRNQKCPGGHLHGHFACGSAHRRRPPDPHLRGRVTLGFWSVPAGIVVAKSALFRTPKYGHPSWCSLAPPLPIEPATLGFGGGPNRVSFAPLSGPLGPGFSKVYQHLHAIPPRLVPAYLFGAAGIGRADGDIGPYAQNCAPFRRGWCPHRPGITAQLPWLCQGRRRDFNASFHQILHTKGLRPEARRKWSTTFCPPDAISQLSGRRPS